MTEPIRVGVLASGGGTNLGALLERVHGREAQIVAVASNISSAPALQRARAAGVEAEAFPAAAGEQRSERDLRIADWLTERGVRLVVLAGYMQILSSAFLKRFPDHVINVHPSLLPAFPGLGAIEQALAYGVKVFGVTVHFVDAGVDSGPVILQRAIELPDARGPDEVLAALRPIEHALLPQAVRLIAGEALRRDPENPRRVVVASSVAG